jgi:uncharacterized protein (DUF1778 family)
MKQKGRPKQIETRTESIEIRLGSLEKKSFRDAANLAGVSTSSWIRERLRRAAIRELEEAAIPIAFLVNKPNG